MRMPRSSPSSNRPEPSSWARRISPSLLSPAFHIALAPRAIPGYDPKGPYTWKTPVPDYRQALDGNLTGLRVGIITEQLHSTLVEPEVREAVIKATSVLSERGAVLDEVSLPLTQHAGIISS